MATISHVMESATRKLKAEQVTRTMYMIDPLDTKFLGMLRIGKRMRNTFIEWPQDSDDAVEADNAVAEGQDPVTYNAIASGDRIGNHAQLMDKAVALSDTAVEIDNYGVASNWGHEMWKKGRALKKEVEAVLLGNQASVQRAKKADAGGTDEGTAGKLAGLTAWLTTNVDAGTGGANGGYNKTTKLVTARTMAPEGNRRNLTEAMYRKMSTTIKENSSGRPMLVLASIKNKERISRIFAGISPHRSQIDGNTRKALTLQGSVDYYADDFGVRMLTYSRYMPKNQLMFVDMSYLGICYLQPWQTQRLARTGHSSKRMLKVEFTLMVKHEGACGIIADLNDGGA